MQPQSPTLNFESSLIDALFAKTASGFNAMKELAKQQSDLLESALASQHQLKKEVDILQTRVKEVDVLKNELEELRRRIAELEAKAGDE